MTSLTPVSPRRRLATVRAALAPIALVLACLLVYNANFRQIGAGDTVFARYLPLMIWHSGSLDADLHAHVYAQGRPIGPPAHRMANEQGKAAYLEPPAYWLIGTRSLKLGSVYPVVTPLLVAPLYWPAAKLLDSWGWQPPHVDRVAEVMEKLVASLIAAAACALMWALLRREGNRWAVPLALAFAFGTNMWMISSQALWQHGTGALLIALAMFLALGPATVLRSMLLGATCVLIAGNRPPDALVAGAIGLFVILREPRHVLWLAAGAAPPMAALAFYNLGFIGHILGGYGVIKQPPVDLRHTWSGLAGLLVSPSRGLLVFSPFLVFVVVGLIQRLKSSHTRVLALLLSLAIIGQLLLYAQFDWRGGSAWGPRWLTDLLPVLVWMLAPAPLVLRPVARGVLIATIVLSVGVQLIGAFWYTKTSDERMVSSDSALTRSGWDFANVPFVTELGHPPASPELLCDARGTFDLVGGTRLPVTQGLPELGPGGEIEGWALACRRSPTQIVLLIRGLIIGTTTQFSARPDVDDVHRTSAPSGWRISANLWGVPPGEQRLQLGVRIDPRSDFRIVREQWVTVRPQLPVETSATGLQVVPSTTIDSTALDAMALRAVALLREHQTDYGAWLTAHTRVPRYETPESELNTFLTATLVDLLAPLSHRWGLEATLEGARAHLGDQIESNGLVRYHGLPDGNLIGQMGCVITPDSDDTALAWRIAGAGNEDARLKPMLAHLARYRIAGGLYRTWLAPRHDYQCIDPGDNPNPTDLGIQLNIYLMLRELDPAAAETLCTSLQHAIVDVGSWVYYAKAPLLPYLRVAEVSELGCTLPLPIERLALPFEGQEIWSEAAYWLVESAHAPRRNEADRALQRLLSQIGADDFALIRRAPPLLYHNDSTATVSRFYWSEDAGYALWLRLYETYRGLKN